jgi:hypothetical protein
MQKLVLFIVAAVALAGAGLYFRLDNAQEAKAQAENIIGQDAAGADTTAAQAALETYVKTHTGSTVSFTLNGAFARAEAAAKAAASAGAANSKIYADAQRACASKTDSVTQARCNHDYLSRHLVNVPNAAPVTAPKLSDYQKTFKAPLWTTDLAGALLLGAVAALALAAFSFWRRKY